MDGRVAGARPGADRLLRRRTVQPGRQECAAGHRRTGCQTLLLELYAGARQTLAEFLDPANRPLTCPGEYADTAIGVTSTSGGRSDDVRACLRATPNRKYVLVVRNQDDVPLTIRGRWISDVWSVKPNESIEIHLSDELQLGQWLSFEPNLYAGVATADARYVAAAIVRYERWPLDDPAPELTAVGDPGRASFAE